LGAPHLVGIMQSNDLSTKEIVAGGEVGRDSDAIEHPPSSNHIINTPLAPRGIIPLLPDLEPDRASPRLGLGHVHQAGPVMGRGNHFIPWGMPPLKAYFRASFNPDLPVRWSRSVREKPTSHIIGMNAIGTHLEVSKRVLLVGVRMRTKSIKLRQMVSINDQATEVCMRANTSNHEEDQQWYKIPSVDVDTMHHDDDDDDDTNIDDEQRRRYRSSGTRVSVLVYNTTHEKM